MKTRLEKLCEAFGKQGGTIHEYNRQFGVDFLEIDETDFNDFIKGIIRFKTDPVALIRELNEAWGEALKEIYKK